MGLTYEEWDGLGESLAEGYAIGMSEPIGRAVCAWCGKDMGPRKGVTGVTHGICPECRQRVEGEYEQASISKGNPAAR